MEILLERQGDLGAIGIKTISDAGKVHRRVIEPGRRENGVFVETDLSSAPSEIVDFAAVVWTPEIVAAWAAKLAADESAQPLPPTDQAILNEALAAQGSVVRALAEVMFKEINKLRVKTGDAAYTKPQFVAALKAEMRG